MALTASQQAGAYYTRKRRRVANAALRALTAWTTGVSVSAGDIRSSDNGSTAWKSTGSGTTGATAPTGTGSQSDGTVTWVRVDIQALGYEG